MVIPGMLKVSSVQQRNTSVSLVISMNILPAYFSRNKYFSSQEHPKYTSYMFLASTTWSSFILLDHIQYWARKILIYIDALWSYSSRWCVPEQAKWMFGKIEQVIIIADDIMIVGYKPDHSDYDQVTTLLQTAKRCNIKLNFDKL